MIAKKEKDKLHNYIKAVSAPNLEMITIVFPGLSIEVVLLLKTFNYVQNENINYDLSQISSF